MSDAGEGAPQPVNLFDLIEEEKARIFRRREHIYLTNGEKDQVARQAEIRARRERIAARMVRVERMIAARRERLDRLEPVDLAQRKKSKRNIQAARDRLGKLAWEDFVLLREEFRIDGELKPARLALSKLELTGLSLSGGGVRSACFNLGLLEGLDREEYQATDPKSGAAGRGPTPCNHLELFDYVSSVSGGSYAAGHLATAMLPARPGAASENSEWLGKVPLTSKTVPGWLWGVGVWSLGVAFQLLKTGALLVCFLALVAFVLRALDEPDAMRFCDVLGFRSDVTRGFVPFWLALGIFLVGWWINDSRWKGRFTVYWFVGSLVIVGGYVIVVMSRHARSGGESSPLSFWFHLASLFAFPVWLGLIWAAHRVERWRKPRRAGFGVDRGADPTWRDAPSIPLRAFLLIPMLVALFCVAGLVTTGDIGLAPPIHGSAQLRDVQERSRAYAEAQDWIIKVALSTLGVTSLAFFFPRDLFRSARRVEDNALGRVAPAPSRLKGWGLGPVYRVVVFLCSYGFILLVVLVVYGTVAREDVSGYYGWRNDLPSAAFHRAEFRDPDQAWERIVRDATPQSGGKPSPWKALAERLKALRGTGELSIESQRVEAAEIRALDSLSWPVRLFAPLKRLEPGSPWLDAGFLLDRSATQLYDAKGRQEAIEDRLALEIAERMLCEPTLHKILPSFEDVPPAGAVVEDPEAYRSRWDKYHSKARSLAELKTGAPAIQAAIRNNNRRALELYLPDLVRDRVADPVVFASIVWAEDQWTRAQVFLGAGLLWLICCWPHVNSFSLQKFYRGHVIDSWVKIREGARYERWLHRSNDTYRGHEFGGAGKNPRPRRAPLLLINATQEGNRSLGAEPDLRNHIFTFSPVASGSGALGHWLNRGHARSLARRSRLDIGNIVATSGAFLSPGNVANPALSAILHLLNIQTGYWVDDPMKVARRTALERLRFHLCQSLGVDLEGDSWFMLTDGAHVENLGLYVLLQRECSLIVASDCSQEDRHDKANRRFDALIQVLQQAEGDGIEVGPFLGSRAYRHWLKTGTTEIEGGRWEDCRRRRSRGLDLVRPPESPVTDGHAQPTRDDATDGDFAQEHYLFAQLIYPGGSRGLLVYLRPTLTGDEGDSLLHDGASSRFPDDDPLDQFYTPAKMNTYRLLGRHIARELMNDPAMTAALAQVTAGQAATEAPCRGTSKPKVGCDPHCGTTDQVCMWWRQRAFRPGTPVNGVL